MSLTSETLAAGLEAMEPTTSESEAIQRFVDAWESFFEGATVGGVAVTPGSFSAGLSAMTSAMAGLSTADNGATAVQAGVTAFWAAIAASPAAMWTGVPNVASFTPPIVAPPLLTGLAAALNATWASNLASELSLPDAAAATAAIIRANGGVGATVPSVLISPPASPFVWPIL